MISTIAQLNLNTYGLLPEILLLVMACSILLVDAYLPQKLAPFNLPIYPRSLIGVGLLILTNTIIYTLFYNFLVLIV